MKQQKQDMKTWLVKPEFIYVKQSFISFKILNLLILHPVLLNSD